jgi:integrase
MIQSNDRGWNLFRRGDGQWVLQHRTSPGKWHPIRIPRQYRTERAAEQYARAWLCEYEKKVAERPTVVTDREDDRPTIRGLVDRWVELCARNPRFSPSTRKQHASNMATHVLAYPEIADVPIAELGPATLRAWLRKVRDGGRVTWTWEKREDGQRTRKIVRGGALAPYTCRNIVGTVTAFFADAVAEEWVALPANPMKHEAVRRELPDGVPLAGRHTIVHLSRPVAEQLLSIAATPQWRRVRTLVALTSGMAEGELAGLRWEDVDLDASIPRARINKALALVGDSGWATLRKTKTANRMRVLPLHTLAVRILRFWKATGWAHWVGHPPSPTDAVFPNDKGEPWRPDMALMLRADLRAAGLPDVYEGHPYTAHATRRSFATWLNEAGVAESTIKRLMGHAGSGVTQQHYTAQTLATLQAAVATIGLEDSLVDGITLQSDAISGRDRGAITAGLSADFGAGLSAGRTMQEAKSPMISNAPPRRFERPANGLGNRCSIL